MFTRTKLRNLLNKPFFKVSIITLLILFCMWMIFYFVFMKEIHVVFTHFFYIPIALAGFWWGKRQSMLIAIILGASLMIPSAEGLSSRVTEDLLRTVMFIGIAWIIGTLRECSLNNERLLSDIITGSSIPTFVINKDHTISQFNRACETLTGFYAKEMIGSTKQWMPFYSEKRPTIGDFVIDGTPEDEISKYYQGKCRKSPIIQWAYEVENLFPIAEKGNRWLRITSAPLRDTSEEVVGAIVTIEDITERKHAEEATKHAYAELNQVFENVADGIRVIDLDFNILKVNNAFSDISGMGKDELIGQKCYEVFRGTRCHTADCPISQIISGTERVEYDVDKERNNGTRIPCILTASALRTPNGELIGVVEVFKDIKDRKRMEEELNEQKIFTEKLIQNSSIPTFVIDSQHNVIAWNKACEMLTGISATNVTASKDISKILYNQNRPLLADLIIESKINELPLFYKKHRKSNIIPEGFQSEAWFKTLAGMDRYLIFETAPIFNSKGELSAVIETLQDITERKLAEEALEERNQKVQMELEMAAKVQQELLPKELPEAAGITFAWEFNPSIYVAGDMFNILRLDENHIGFYVLDVMGHGISAALKAVTLSYFLKPSSYTSSYLNKNAEGGSYQLILPSQILGILNERFSDESKNVSFFTIFYGILNTQSYSLSYARAGHCPPIIISNDQTILELEKGGPAIGLSKHATYKDYICKLNPGDRLLLHTDGLIEAKSSNGEPYSKKRLIDFCLCNKSKNIADLTHLAVSEVLEYTGNKETKDDLTLLGIEIPR